MTKTNNNFKEIERKFLLSELPRMPPVIKDFYRYQQGYIKGAGLIKERLTIQYIEPIKYRRAVKIGSGIERHEFQETISKEFFDKMWGITEGNRIHKMRWHITCDDLIWEIDYYLDRTLVIAEVEISTAETEIKIPEWIKEMLVREVTEEKEFEGYNMGK